MKLLCITFGTAETDARKPYQLINDLRHIEQNVVYVSAQQVASSIPNDF